MNAARPGGPAPAPPPASVSPTRRAWVLTSAAAVGLVAVGWPILAAVHGVHAAVAMVLALAQAAALPVAVRWPRAAVGLGAAAALGSSLAAAPVPGPPWPWPVTTLIAYALLVLVVALRARWRTAVAAWLGGLLVSVLAIGTALSGTVDGALANAVVAAAVTGVVGAAGVFQRQLWLSRRLLRAERRVSAQQQAQRLELQQRNRIAQELHDVVAHSMSVISVQATTAPYRLPGLDESVRQEFASIAGSSRRALAEMRGLLAVLRGDDAAATAPQPGLGDIPELIETTRASGAVVELEMEPAASDERVRAVPPATGLTAYRIVQEAVSNALRHAPGAPVSAWVEVSELEVAVSVFNGPAQDPGRVPVPGSGLGLQGIRDRALALGGTVQAGPTSEGGFSVRARLPLG